MGHIIARNANGVTATAKPPRARLSAVEHPKTGRFGRSHPVPLATLAGV